MKQGPLLILGIFALLLLLASACGGGTATPTPTRQPTPTPTPTSPSFVPATPTPTATTPPDTTSGTTQASGGGGGEVTLEINTPDDQLKYSTNSMSAPAGSTVLVKYTNGSSVFQHNWVLVEADTKDEVARDGGNYPDNGYIPPGDDRVLAAINPLVEAGEVGQVQFEAPAVGRYEFVCTFPGHNATKFGTFEVK